MLTFDETKQITLPDLVDHLAVMDRYIYALRKDLEKQRHDTTSTSYQFSLGLMEMMKETRAELIGDYARVSLGLMPTEIVAEIFEKVELDFSKSLPGMGVGNDSF